MQAGWVTKMEKLELLGQDERTNIMWINETY